MSHDPRPSLAPGGAWALGALFTVTGATALTVEQVFEKLLSTVVGASTPAGAVVLAVFFLGQSLGGVAYGHLRSRVRHPLRLYASLEGVVALSAAALSVSFPLVQDLSARLVSLGGDSAAAVLALRVLVSAAWMIVPTVAMGATFPAVVGVLQAGGFDEVRQKKLVSRLYALNLLGAMAGTVAAPYLLFPSLGLTGALRGVAAAQLVVVGTALLLARASAQLSSPAAAPASIPGGRGRLAASLARLLGDGDHRVLVLVSFCSGLIVFSVEVVWIHLIGAVIGMSVYAFALMLGVVLLGLFLGSALISLVQGRRGLTDAALPRALALSGLVLLLFSGLWDRAPLLLLAWGKGAGGFWPGEWVRLRVALLVMLPPAVALGTVYPTLLRVRSFPAEGADAAAGVLGAVNAVGSIAGSLLTGFWVLPALGAEATLHALAALPVALGVGVAARRALRSEGGVREQTIVGFAAALTALAWSARGPWDRLLLSSGANVYFEVHHVQPDSRLTFWHEDTYGGITTVVESGDGRVRTLLTGGKFQGNDGEESAAQIGFALIPFLLAPDHEEVLVVGMGTAHSAAVLSAAGAGRLAVAELAPGIVQAARGSFAALNERVLERPEVSVVLEDGRNHLLRSDRRWSLISIELTSVWFAGAGNLYSREFYELARSRLRPHGVVQQWVQLHHLAPREILSMVATMRDVFPVVSFWFVGEQGILVGGDGPQALLPERFAALRARPRMARQLVLLEKLLRVPVERLGEYRLLTPAGVDRLWADARATGVPLSTDGNRFLEYATPRHALEKQDHATVNLHALLRYTEPERRAAQERLIGLAPLP